MSIVGLCLCCKQKSSYELRISDWSSDVCSSDLGRHAIVGDQKKIGGASSHQLRHHDFFDCGEFNCEGGRDGAVERLPMAAAQAIRELHAAASKSARARGVGPSSSKR